MWRYGVPLPVALSELGGLAAGLRLQDRTSLPYKIIMSM